MDALESGIGRNLIEFTRRLRDWTLILHGVDSESVDIYIHWTQIFKSIPSNWCPLLLARLLNIIAHTPPLTLAKQI